MSNKSKCDLIDLEFIKEFSKLSLTAICRECNVNRSNLLNGKTSGLNIWKVRNYIVFKFNDLVEKNMDDKYGKYHW